MNRGSRSREERLTDLELLVVVLTKAFSRVDAVLMGKLQNSAQILGEGQPKLDEQGILGEGKSEPNELGDDAQNASPVCSSWGSC